MWSTAAACIVCILSGIICNVKQVYSQPKWIQRTTDHSPDEASISEEDIQKVINEILSLSDQNVNKRSFSATYASGDLDLNAYYQALSDLYAVFQPLLRDRFLDDLPKTLVCILSGRQDCGLEAELTKTVSLELGKPLLSVLSSLRSQTCTTLNPNRGSTSFLSGYLRTGESTSAALDGFQNTLIKILSSFPLSGSLMGAVSSLVDVAVTYISEFLATFMQIPMDYLKIALQFGVRIPSLEGKETCEQGDLKQLIMWGINNNVSWSFGISIIDILLDVFLAPEQPPCTYPGPECSNPQSVPLQRSVSESKDYTDDYPDILLKCDRHNLAKLNDTLCADILKDSKVGSSTSVLTFCRELSSLSANQVEQVWSNTCYVIQALMSPLFSRSSDCAHSPPAEAVLPHSELPRVAREASNLRQLACNYNTWLEDEEVNPVLVSLCSDNERKEFSKQVCNNAPLMKKLLSEEMNSWLYGYCANSSADSAYLVSQFCVYEQWMDQPSVNPFLLEFCTSLDGPRLTALMCEHVGFFMLLFSNHENGRLIPNCTALPLPPLAPDMDSLMLQSCRYSEWHNVMNITVDVLSECVRLDHVGFTQEVCSNKTFLNSLLLNQENAWLETHCEASLTVIHPVPTEHFSIASWCDYQTWGERQVDDSVVGLCWQHDQLAFQENVCCKTSVFEKLLKNPQNKWLTSLCREKEIEEIAVLPQVCKYTEWTRPIIVDMTEVALCAETDPLNFTTKVCSNQTVLQNLLANQDNTWLLQHCANHSNSGVPPDGGAGQGEGLAGFNPAEQCQYSSWSVSLPDAALLTLCWEHDQPTFISSICPDARLLFLLSREPSSVWVDNMCTTYANYTTIYNNSNTSPTMEPNFCLARNLLSRFNWSCSADLSSACQPGASQNMALQMMVHCWVENMRSRVKLLLTPPVATVLEQAVSTTVVILLALEEVQNTSLHVSENIRLSVLSSVVHYLESEDNFDKKRVLLQCFGRVLTSLMQTARGASSDESSVIKEYFNIPLSRLRSVLSSAHITTIRLILEYYNRNKDTLQLPDLYLSTMVSVLFQTHLVKDDGLFPHLAPLLAAASPADIQALPSLQNSNVRETINKNLKYMTLEQRRAFGLWFSKVMSPSDITRGHKSLIRDTGNLIAYLPFHNFQHLLPAQLLDGLEVLHRNTLTSLKQEFISNSIISTYRNLTAQDLTRLGNLSCLADPEDLLEYEDTEVFSVIRDIVMNCTHEGLSLPSQLVSSLLLDSTDLKVPFLLRSDRLAELAHLLPSLGVPFLQDLTPSQLHAILPILRSVSFSPVQGSIIIDKLSTSNTLTTTDQLQQLGSLVVGLKTEALLSITSDRLLSSLPAMAQYTPGLSPLQANAIATKLWGFPEVVGWLDDVEPLLYCTPLLSVMPRTRLIVNNITTASTTSWNTQQAIAIFKEMLETKPNLIRQDFLNLGTVAQGVSCTVLQERFGADSSSAAVRRILLLLRQQPSPLHTSVKRCVIEELYQFEFFSEMLTDLGAEIALSMPVSTIKKFPTDMMDTLRRMINQEPQHFLMLARTKQELLVDKMVERMGMYTGVFTEEEFRSLGIMAPFVVDLVLIQLDRSFFTENLDYIQGLCFSSSKMDAVASILQDPAAFGPTKNWNKTTVSQVGRFLFFLPEKKLQEIPFDLMTVGLIEKLFMSQRQWERGDVGIHCLNENDRRKVFQKQQFVLQFFLGFLKINLLSPAPMVPTCEILHTTAPSAWTSSSLTSMTTSAFANCLELIGQDPFLASYQRSQVLEKVKQIYGPVSSFSQSVITQLGWIATELSLEELSRLRLTERRSIAAMGAINAWNNRQLAALFTAILNSTKQSPSQLDHSTLGAMGYIVCGAKTTEINVFNAVEFSKAVLQLGQLKLSCSAEQLQAFFSLLTHRLAFGYASSWGTDVFIEIGVLAAGLPDMAMSALVKMQVEGILPEAISMIPADKFAVVFNEKHISMFFYEQAAAVTEEQLSKMSDVQKTALSLVLTPWEARPVDFRVLTLRTDSRPVPDDLSDLDGKSLALALGHSRLCLILGLLMLLIILP